MIKSKDYTTNSLSEHATFKVIFSIKSVKFTAPDSFCMTNTEIIFLIYPIISFFFLLASYFVPTI